MKGKREMKSNKKGMTALVALVLILCCTVGGTLAWLVTTSGPVENTFTPGSVTTEINEEFKDGVKSNVTVKNTGNVDAYIRATIVVNWADEKGNVYAETPKLGENYTLAIGTGWTKGADGYYYYNGVVAAGASTADGAAALITSCQRIGNVPAAGYDLQVTILAEGLQAEGWPATATNAEAAFAEAAKNA